MHSVSKAEKQSKNYCDINHIGLLGKQRVRKMLWRFSGSAAE